jgi:hypothetical protein
MLADHVAHFMRDTVYQQLDLSEICLREKGEQEYPPYTPGDDDRAAVRVLIWDAPLAPHRQSV